MNDPRVTVVIPVYNGERYIAEAVESVLAQTVPCRLVVVDDGSTDRTVSIANKYPRHWDYVVQSEPFSTGFECRSHEFVILLQPGNQGAARALNRAIRHADTEFVAWLSHDDVFEPEKIKRQLEAIGDADACYTDFDIIGADGALVEHVRVKPPPPEDMFRQIIVRNIINGSSMLIRRDAFERVGLFRDDLRVDVDGEMWLRMIGAGISFVHVPEMLLKYRRHGGQLSANRELMRQTKDRVRAEAIERTPPERAFPGAESMVDDRLLAAAYRDLSMAMSNQGLTLAAAAARHKSLDVLHDAPVDLHTDL